ncbi:hypothetical protein O6H91_07G045900 [Diphasiastrum complanatum]|uniref:Uncharacterized protein n=1 Tax=Diphasiastrum complanatum TaxID=34168 RepID=A0ACC2D4U2_DIPCM|nr:hypothetical protein O6H91_07G045900 [Diphasiastrum complanatum]
MGEEAAPVTRQRKKRKWDQPAEGLPATVVLPTMLPLNGVGGLAAIGFPGVFTPVGVFPTLPATAALSSTGHVAPAVAAIQQQNAAAIVQKINLDLKGIIPQPKMQDELIAREIVINDADPGIRYKLTKRQTQEEIQSKSGAVVITRGRYKPPSGPVDHEKPLYLHISAGVHLKDTAERIKAVDQGAAIVEEMLKQGRQSQLGPPAGPLPYGMGSSLLTSMVYVGCDADASFDLLGRIRGPNDQYLIHIMKETGAIVMLRGRGSGNAEETTLPPHLYISCDNAKNLDDARRLAESLLETVLSESSLYQVPLGIPHAMGQIVPSIASGSLVTSLSPQPAIVGSTEAVTPHAQPVPLNRVYAAVPPPEQLLSDGTPTSEEVISGPEENSGAICASTNEPILESDPLSTTLSKTTSFPFEAYSSPIPVSAVNFSEAGYSAFTSSYPLSSNEICPFGPMPSYGQFLSSPVPQIVHSYAHAASAVTTSYCGYSGVYPQISPLQQVAMVLQRPPPPLSVKAGDVSSSLASSIKPPPSSNHAKQQEKQPGQRRKFQEFRIPKEPSKDNQQQVGRMSGNSRVGEPSHRDNLQESKSSLLPTAPVTKKEPFILDMLPVHVATSSPAMKQLDEQDTTTGAGIKLVDYAEEDEETSELSLPLTPPHSSYVDGKPFWAP